MTGFAGFSNDQGPKIQLPEDQLPTFQVPTPGSELPQNTHAVALKDIVALVDTEAPRGKAPES